jgi:hypothetical protein
MVGAFAPNKRVDIAIEALNRLKLPLLSSARVSRRESFARLRGR